MERRLSPCNYFPYCSSQYRNNKVNNHLIRQAVKSCRKSAVASMSSATAGDGEDGGQATRKVRRRLASSTSYMLAAILGKSMELHQQLRTQSVCTTSVPKQPTHGHGDAPIRLRLINTIIQKRYLSRAVSIPRDRNRLKKLGKECKSSL